MTNNEIREMARALREQLSDLINSHHQLRLQLAQAITEANHLAAALYVAFPPNEKTANGEQE